MNAHMKEAETEEHLHAIADREEGRLKQETIRHQNDLEQIREKRNNFEVTILIKSFITLL